MSMPEIDYSKTSFGVYKIAYDLALLYAKSKFENKLQNGFDFDKGIAPVEIEELEYLSDTFLFALDYFSALEPGDIEKMLKQFHYEGFIP